MDSTLSNVAGLDFVCLTVPAALKYVKAQSVLEAEGGSTRDKGLRRPLSFVSFTFLHFCNYAAGFHASSFDPLQVVKISSLGRENEIDFIHR